MPTPLERLLPAALVLLAACGAPSGPPVAPPEEWEESWADEFDGPAGQLPDPSRWVFDVGGGGWGNNQLEYDTDSPDNASLDGDGHLVITARKQAFDRNQYTSARIKTQGRFSQRYGRVEARLRVPKGRGLWPAFWMLGDDIGEAGWPKCGEIDIMELRGQEPNIVLGSLHGPGFSGASPVTASFRLKSPARFDLEFHTFAVEWDPGRVAFLVDGEPYNIVGAGDVLGRGDWVFDQPFFLILNLAVGGNFLGNPDSTTTFPQALTVDWVRVYRRVR